MVGFFRALECARTRRKGTRLALLFLIAPIAQPLYHRLMFEPYRCPMCQSTVDIDLTAELERGQTDLRERIDQRQDLKLDLPKRLLVTCTHCGRQFIIQP